MGCEVVNSSIKAIFIDFLYKVMKIHFLKAQLNKQCYVKVPE